ncbi:MAG: translocation/assembly module TamB [Duncaniella sp.]|nr:translocation/assembly module TamB [Duncaniella sp.]
MANPFLPAGTAKLRGTLNGEMTITGDMAAPMFDGFLSFDSAAVKVAMLGTEFIFPDEKIPVDSNIVTFTDFGIRACNENPLTINGTVDLRHLSNVALDLDMNARHMQIVNSERARGADVYGKAFVNLDAKARGNMQRITVDADLTLLAGTNVTYVLPTTSSELTTRTDENMVKFVNFADPTTVVEADSVAPAMLMWVNADLKIEQGTVVNVDLNANGSNRVQIQSNGDLDFSMSPLNGMRMTGRLNIDGGFARYSVPPILSEKNFAFQNGSYVAFNGDVMNPVLNVKGIDVMKANVTQSGSDSRLVNFDVILSVTGTLSSMDVAFDLSTNDDITVQNELTSMSAEQRANQAMNLLLYGAYTGAGTKASTNLTGNPLFSLLTSQLNSWAANSIKGVDISFGIDQYDSTREGSTSTTTSYSYRVSKSLFNDRFKIVVGGKYSTDANADENFSQNLINDISFEYMLNRSGSMYVRVFRHTGYESILEGEITQTGVGFVLRRKLNNLFELIGIRRD